jgi:putative nucleotidyltransferase with HDIG domain
MSQKGRFQSLFSQRLDRAVFAAYFLGGVVPIAALGWVAATYVLPANEGDPRAMWAWTAGFGCLGMLSLAVYFALRRITHGALERMNKDNRRLRALLSASRELAEETHSETILGRTATHAADAVDSAAGLFLLFSPDQDKPLELRHSSGSESVEWLRSREAAVIDLADAAIADSSAAETPSDVTGRRLVATPFQQRGGARGAIVVAGDSGVIVPEAVDALSTLARMAAGALQRGDLEDSQRNFFAHVTDLIVSALDAHVVHREGHAMNVARLSNRLAHEIGLPHEAKERLHFGAMMHDIGMLKIDPGHHRDRRAVRRHPAIGARMLQRIRLWEAIAPIVLMHHEWWDGNGYPEGRVGEDIPLEARIVAVADSVDAMRRPEDANRGAGLSQIVEELTKCRGTQFDPAVVDAFNALAERGEIDF